MAEELTTQAVKHKYGSKPEVDQADLIKQAKESEKDRDKIQRQREALGDKTLNRKRV